MCRSFTAAIVRLIVIGPLAAGVWGEAWAADVIKITKLEPTAIFPKVKTGQPCGNLPGWESTTKARQLKQE